MNLEFEKVIMKKRGRNIAYKLFLNPLYHLKYLLWYGKVFTDEISIGTSTSCNLRCENCPNSIYDYSLKENEILMEETLFHKIINELGEINYRGCLWFHFFNEPLMDSRLLEFVKYAKSRIPKAKINISSNGTLLTLKKYKELIKDGVDGFTITQYAKEIPKNLPRIVNYDKRNGNYITFRVFTDKLRENWGGNIKGNILEKPRCSYPQNSLAINPKGEVILCCNDYHSSMVWGDLKSEKLTDIFDKKEFEEFRDDAKKGIFYLSICKKCRGIG